MMMTRKAESDTLPTWMQTGKSPDQTWWKESSGCNTNFKSSVMIRDGYEGVNRELKKLYETFQYKEFLRFFATWRKNTIHA